MMLLFPLLGFSACGARCSGEGRLAERAVQCLGGIFPEVVNGRYGAFAILEETATCG
ncbi:MAG: hypothetical protein ACLTDR_16650 [Adlercreutzia equolifaciens]